MSEKPKLLVACRDPGGAQALSPVVLRMISENKTEVVCIGYKFSEDVFTKNNVPFKKIEDFGISEVTPDSMEALLDKIRPNMLVLGTSQGRSIENDLVVAARKKGIGTFCLLDYWNSYWQRFSCHRTGRRFEFLPDYIGIMDEFARDEMVAEGFDPGRLIITGQPYFDGLFELKNKFTESDRMQFRKRFNISRDSLLISFFSQGITRTRGADRKDPGYLGYTQITVLGDLITALKSLRGKIKKDIVLFIRPHPREPVEDIMHFASDNSFRVIIDKDNTDPRHLMFASDVVSGMFTMLLVEAYLAGKSVLSIQIGLKKTDELVLSRQNIIKPVYRREDLLPALEGCLSGRQKEQKWAFKVHENSTRAVMATIYNLLS